VGNGVGQPAFPLLRGPEEDKRRLGAYAQAEDALHLSGEDAALAVARQQQDAGCQVRAWQRQSALLEGLVNDTFCSSRLDGLQGVAQHLRVWVPQLSQGRALAQLRKGGLGARQQVLDVCADLGFQGVAEPRLLEDICNGCQLCVRGCEEQALRMENDLPVRDASLCNACGDCIKVCPVDAMIAARRGWLVRAGGKHGKHPIFAYEVANCISDEQAYLVIERSLEWYRANGLGRERIGATFARVGVDKYIDEVIKPLGVEAIEKAEDRRKFKAAGNFYE